jgi:hypothetical protein
VGLLFELESQVGKYNELEELFELQVSTTRHAQHKEQRLCVHRHTDDQMRRRRISTQAGTHMTPTHMGIGKGAPASPPSSHSHPQPPLTPV